MLVLLIHGAYTSPWHWHRLVPFLEEAGCEVVVPELPIDDPGAGLEQYAATVEAEFGDREEPPLVVGSSFGAVTACIVASRRAVRGLVTVCGIVPRPGEAVAADSGITQSAYNEAIEWGADGTTTFPPRAACEIAFNDSDPDLAQDAASRLRRQGVLPFTEPCPLEAMPDVPRRGIVAEGDRLVRPEWLAGAVRERLGVDPVKLPGDHTPMLSRPAELADLLLQMA